MAIIADGGKKKRKPKYANPRAKKVYVAPKANKTVRATVKYGVRDINKDVGEPVVRRVKKKGKADVVVKATLKTRYQGSTTAVGNRERIRLNKKYLAVPTTEHEIGHTLGLPHTTGKKNLMNPYGEDTKLNLKQKSKAIRKHAKPGPTRKKPL
jgi:predicted Zn-dependent protease